MANPVEMEEGVFRGIFDRVRDLVALDRGLEEVEWEIIGGEITKMPVEFWRRNLPFALEQCRDFNAQLKTPGSVNVLSNLIFSDQRRRADYIDLFNQYGDWPEMCVYTSWEPETNRFGKRDKLMPAWRETVSALKVRQKILDVILTKTTVELGPDYLLEQFLPLGVTDFSIKMISPYGSGKVRIPRHSDTQPTLIRTPVPRSFGQAVGAQRRRGGIVSPGWLASSISASVCALIHPSD
ncbi:hypothetical protein [Pseudomonas putida]|uniref:hypothetical protein n=1 Tax=Pseudomonas putida TaxID=303 RepID=UPI001E343490|nr:hypothetical protein [Pseudomonas putida]